MANKIEILIDTVYDNAGALSAYSAIGAVLGAVVDFTKKAVEETVKYSESVSDLNRIIGAGISDSSAFVQIADDLDVSYSTLTSAMQTAVKNGYVPTIDNLKKMQVEYAKLDGPAERATYANEIFGKSALEMQKILEKSPEQLDAMVEGYERVGLILSDTTDIDNYKQSVENLENTWAGVKTTVGQKVIPELDLLFKMLLNGSDEIVKMETKAWRLETGLFGLATSSEKATEKASLLRAQIAWLTGEFETGEAGVSAFYTGISQMGALSFDTSGLEPLKTELSAVTSLFREMTAEMLFAAAAEGMNTEQALLLAESMGLVDSNTQFAYSAIANLHQQYKDGKITIEQYNEQVTTLWGTISDLQSKTITITVRGEIDEAAYGAMAFFGQGEHNPYIGLSGNSRAVGGAVAPNVPYLVGENGPEIFKPNSAGSIIPNGQIGGYSGGGDFDYTRLGDEIVQAMMRSGYVR